MSHTPAPWTRVRGERFRHDNSAGIRGLDGTYIGAALDLNREDRDTEVEDNALVMAASPGLLSVVEEVIRGSETWYVPDDTLDRLRFWADQARGRNHE